MAEDSGHSIVEYLSDNNGNRCGYCKSKDTSYSHGMWAHKMSVQNYQDLIDRGWRRSGKYCYKPTMNKSCCPQYTIKCDALNFQLSKSQKKLLKSFHAYLSYGTCHNNAGKSEDDNGVGSHETDFIHPRRTVQKDLSQVNVSAGEGNQQQPETMKVDFEISPKKLCSEKSHPKECTQDGNASCTTEQEPRKKVKAGMGQDLSKPPCKKAKLLRKERRAVKLASLQPEDQSKEQNNPVKRGTSSQPKSLEDYLNAPMPENPAHRLEMRLVTALSIDRDYKATLETSHSMFKKYQMAIHKEPESKCTRSRYEGFLCNSSLQPWKPTHGPSCGYGPFHYQYWLDEQLIAVGVMDILPNSISSVYLYYDPKFSFLSLGTYSSLREIAFTRELHRSAPNLKWYYMGFYIHSCPKMRYKCNYDPSFLLCPETYTWVPVKICGPKLDVKKYSRLRDDIAKPKESTDTSKVQCLYKGCIAQYRMVQNSLPHDDDDDEEEVKEYLSLVGAKIAASLLLYRS